MYEPGSETAQMVWVHSSCHQQTCHDHQGKQGSSWGRWDVEDSSWSSWEGKEAPEDSTASMKRFPGALPHQMACHNFRPNAGYPQCSAMHQHSPSCPWRGTISCGFCASFALGGHGLVSPGKWAHCQHLQASSWALKEAQESTGSPPLPASLGESIPSGRMRPWG